MNRPRSSCRLVFTDARFVFAKRSYPGVPLLVDAAHQFVEPACDYLRWRVVYGHLSPSSAKTYAESLLHFWNFLHAQGHSYDEVNDKIFLEWLNAQSHTSDSTRAARCDAVFEMYVWLETEGYIQHVVRIPGVNDDKIFTPRLSARVTRGGHRGRGRFRFGIVSALRPPQTAPGILYTPDTVDIGRLHAAVAAASTPDVVERNHLLIDWYLQTGVRRIEWCSLTVDQIPPWSEIDSAQESFQVREILLTATKGGRPRYAGVLPELLERTREYIDGPRAELVARFRERYRSGYREPKEVFLSSKTGRGLRAKAITNLLSHLFTSANVEGHGHRLRATYLTRLFEAELMVEYARVAANPGALHHVDLELVLRRVAERAGHRDPESLRPYLTVARKRIARSAEMEKLLTVQQQLQAKLDALAYTEEQLKARQTSLN